MKSKNIIFIAFITTLFFSSGLWITKIFFLEDKVFSDQVYNHFLSLLDSRDEMIKDYVKERQRDARILKESEHVKKLFRQNLFSPQDVAEQDVERRMLVALKETDTYLKINNRLTLRQLQKSQEFRSVAIRPFGQTGLVSILEETWPIKSDDFQGVDDFGLDALDKNNATLVSLVRKAQKEGVSDGTYLWRGARGITCQKYSRFERLGARTADGAGIIVHVSVCLREYRVTKDPSSSLSRFIDDFREENGYKNIIFISLDGYLVHTVKPHNYLGIKVDFLEGGLSTAYLQAKEKGELIVHGPYKDEFDETMQIVYILPVTNGKNTLGFIGIIDEMESLNEIITAQSGLGESGDTYIVNNDGFLITPVRFSKFDLLTQIIKTRNLADCLRELSEQTGEDNLSELSSYRDSSAKVVAVKNNKRIYSFLNYLGEETYGAHTTFPQARWCILAEVSVKEVFDAPKQGRVLGELFSLTSTVILLLAAGYVIKRRLKSTNQPPKVKQEGSL